MRSDPPLYSGLSVEFKCCRQSYAGGRRVVEDAILRGAALTDLPSYPDTSVEVRTDTPETPAHARYPPMALNAAGLAAALGIKVANADDPDDPGLVEADRLLTLAGALVEAYARDPRTSVSRDRTGRSDHPHGRTPTEAHGVRPCGWPF